jgi:CMP-N-acetylneuraminic acid synthetase
MQADVVALITARGGSKRLPRKNVLPVAGKPLLAWSIEAALGAPSIRRVIVSTDDQEIAAAAREYGAEIPFLRPSELAGDTSPHIDVVLHAARWLEQAGDCPEYLLVLQPTSPLRSAEDIEGIIEFAGSRAARGAVSLRPAVDHPMLCRRIDDHRRLQHFIEPPVGYVRTQDLPPAYSINGALYLIRTAALFAEKQLILPDSVGYVMPPERSLDVDDAWDLRLADILLRARIDGDARAR